jgi:hypothetical protein
VPFYFWSGNLKKLLTKVNLLNPNSAIVFFGLVMAMVLKIGIDQTSSSGQCCSQGAPFSTASLCFCYWTLARGPSILAVSSVILAVNKVVAAIAQQPVRHLSLPDLAVCCSERAFHFLFSNPCAFYFDQGTRRSC